MSQGAGCGLLAALDGRQASVNTKEHAVYAYFFLGFPIARIATIYRKGQSTISRWIERYKQSADLSRRPTGSNNNKFSQEHRAWILRYIMKHPLSFLDETKRAFILYWGVNISVSSVWRLMRECNLTHKVIDVLNVFYLEKL
jgi:transposase